MFTNIHLISTSKRCIQLPPAVTIKQPKLQSSETCSIFCISSAPHRGSSKVLKDSPDDCDKTFFKTSTFHRFHVHLFKQCSPQLNDQTDTDFIMNILPLHLLKQNHSVDTFLEDNKTVSENLTKEVIFILTQTEFDKSTDTKLYPKRPSSDIHGCFCRPENFSLRPAIY